MNRFKIIGFTLVLIVVASTAFAARPRISVDVPPGETFPGDGQNLPVGCAVTSNQLIAYARNMSKVQVALAEFDRRGYVSRGVYARVGCYRPNLDSRVCFVYNRSVTYPTPDSSYALIPAILVITRLSDANGEPSTTVSAGVVALNPDGEVIASADSLVPPDEASFDVRPRNTEFTSTETSRAPSGFDDWWVIHDPQSYFSRWVWCSGLNSWRNLAFVVWKGGGIGARAKLALFLGESEFAGGIIATCIAEASLECLVSVSRHP